MSSSTNSRALSFYYIDGGYLDKLREADSNVPYSNYEEGTNRLQKFYFGPIHNDGAGIDYFVPISSQSKHDASLVYYEKGYDYTTGRTPKIKKSLQFAMKTEDADGNLLGILDFRYMVPVMNDPSMDDYIRPKTVMLSHQRDTLDFCMNNMPCLKQIAADMYRRRDGIDAIKHDPASKHNLMKSAVNIDAIREQMFDFIEEEHEPPKLAPGVADEKTITEILANQQMYARHKNIPQCSRQQIAVDAELC